MSNKKFIDNEKIIARLKEQLGVKTDTGLAKKLDYSSVSAISNWRNGSIAWDRIVENFSSLNFNYIITGEENVKNTNTQKKSIDESWSRLEEYVASHGISDRDRVQLIAVLRDRARTLSNDLRYFSDLIDDLDVDDS